MAASAGWCAETGAAEQPTTQPAPKPGAGLGLSEQLVGRPADIPVTLPQGANLARPKPANVPAPGSPVVDRLCRLERSGRTAWHVLRFVPESGRPPEPPRYVLLSRLLEQIEHIADLDPRPLLRVTGYTTVYKGRAFLLLAEPPMIIPAARRPQPATQPAKPPGQTPATAPAPTTQASPPTANQIRQMLLNENVGRPMPMPARVQPEEVQPAPSVAPGRDRPHLPYGPDVTIVADRLVRLVPERKSGWLMARFESDNTLQQPPLRLLPCKKLEEAETAAAQAMGRMTKFHVSGRVTVYKGRQYLLIWKLLRERDMNQF